MTDYDNTNTGAIWRVKDKKSDKHPDYNGTVNIEGVEYWVSGWGRPTGSDPKTPAVKFAFSIKEARQDDSKNQESSNQPAQGMTAEFDSDIPF